MLIEGSTNTNIFQSIRHSGGNPGFESLVTFLPSDGIGIVVLINAFDKGDDTEKVTNRVMDIILGVGDKHHMFSERYIYLVDKGGDGNDSFVIQCNREEHSPSRS